MEPRRDRRAVSGRGEGRPPAIASLPHAHRHPRHPRHPRALRRLRDARRGAVGAASRRAGTTSRSTRAPATRSRAFASGAARRSACFRRSRRSTSTRSCTVSSRAIDSAFERFDAVLVCNAINAATSFLPRLSGKTRVVLNVDGLERNRRKWSAAGKARLSDLRVGSRRIIPDVVVSDARVIQDVLPGAVRLRLGLHPLRRRPPDARRASTPSNGSASSPEKYVLYVSRLEPENNAEEVGPRVPGRPGRDVPLVVVGDAPYAADYIARIRAAADRRVRPAGRDLRRGVPAAPVARRRLRPGDRGRRNAPGARRGPRDTGASSATTRRRRTRRWRGARRCLSTCTNRAAWRAFWPGSWMIRPATPYGRNGHANAVEERYRWDDVVDRYEAVLEAGRAIP